MRPNANSSFSRSADDGIIIIISLFFYIVMTIGNKQARWEVDFRNNVKWEKEKKEE